MWPRIIMIALMAIAIVDNIEHWGEPETGKTGKNGVSGVLAIVLCAMLLWWGGFWDLLLAH